LSAAEEVNEAGMDWESLAQYIGRRDLNDNEIYEGDVVNIWQRLTEHKNGFGLTMVEFVNGQWNIYDRSIFTIENGVEIIGNIYENPELLPRKD
jgi:uncharacterized phage protein (TIGR01671 family)